MDSSDQEERVSDDLSYDIVGQCEAPSDARGITNCIHCGKELRDKYGE